MNFTREQQQKRLERFLSLLEEQKLSQYAVPSNSPGKTFIVCSESDLARVHLGAMGGIQLTARNGQLRGILRAWIAQEWPSFKEYTERERFAELDTYRYLLQSPQGQRLHDHPAKSAMNTPQGRKILQIIPAQPGWWAVFAAAWNVEEGEEAFYRAPMIGWALVEEDNKTEVVAMIVLAADSNSEPEMTIWLVGEKGDGFLGFQYPGAATDWSALAEIHRQACLDETTRWWKC